jgi:hypothetical protein
MLRSFRVALEWLWGAYQLAINRLCGGFEVALTSLWVALPGFLLVGCWLFGVHHKRSKYNAPLPPPLGWSGGALVPPWTYPGTIEPPQSPFFEQVSLSKSVSCGLSAV